MLLGSARKALVHSRSCTPGVALTVLASGASYQHLKLPSRMRSVVLSGRLWVRVTAPTFQSNAPRYDYGGQYQTIVALQATHHARHVHAAATAASPRAGGGTRPPLPPFTEATAAQKVQMAEDAWNTR